MNSEDNRRAEAIMARKLVEGQSHLFIYFRLSEDVGR